MLTSKLSCFALLWILVVVCMGRPGFAEDVGSPSVLWKDRQARAIECEKRHDFDRAKALRTDLLATAQATFGREHWITREAQQALDDVAVLRLLPRIRLAEVDAARAKDELIPQYFVHAEPKAVANAIINQAELCRTLFGPTHPKIADYAMLHGDLYFMWRNYEAAAHQYRDAREAFARSFGKQHPRYAMAAQREWMANCESGGPDGAALSLLQQAIAVRKGMIADKHRAPEPEPVGESIRDAGAIFGRARRVDAANSWLTRELKIVNELYGEESAEACALYVTLAQANLSDPHRAEHFVDRALAIRRQSGVARPDQDAQALFVRGWIYMQTFQFEEAAKFVEEALTIHRQLGAKRDVARDLMFLCIFNTYKKGDLTAAVKYSEEAQSAYDSLESMSYGERTDLLASRGYLYYRAGEYEKAAKCHTEALTLAESVSPGGRVFMPIARALLSRSQSYSMMGRLDEAEADAREAARIYSQLYGEEDANAKRAREALSGIQDGIRRRL